jgi:hypothetical protein
MLAVRAGPQAAHAHLQADHHVAELCQWKKQTILIVLSEQFPLPFPHWMKQHCGYIGRESSGNHDTAFQVIWPGPNLYQNPDELENVA